MLGVPYAGKLGFIGLLGLGFRGATPCLTHAENVLVVDGGPHASQKLIALFLGQAEIALDIHLT